jgi:hypothetical protein
MCPWHTIDGKMSDNNLEQQISMTFCAKIGKRATETSALLTLAFGKYALMKSGIF